MHWQEMYKGEIPTSLELPRELEGDSLKLEGEEIQIVNLEMVETVKATALHVPSAKTLVAADLVYSKCHHYMSDVGRADTWIQALESTRKLGQMDTIIPGHGPVGGTKLFDESIQWMRDYLEVAKPDVRFIDIAKGMMNRYPKWGLGML
ncbi:MAG: hypothetical protein ACRD7E_15375, partial [Bryobacteraceae bacterium]